MKMSTKTAFKWLGIVLLILGFGLTTFSAAPAEERKEILIGATIPLTGPFASAGRDEMRWAYQEAVIDVNKAGGIFLKELGKKLPVRLILVDDESDPGKAAAGVERLIKVNKVDLLLSTVTTPNVLPSVITAEKYKTYYHGTTCFIEVWRPQNLMYSTIYFMLIPDLINAPFEVLNSIPAAKRPNRLAMLMEDSLDGRALGPGLRDGAKANGVKFVVDEPWAVGSKDYSAQILKLRGKKIDGIYIFGAPADLITFRRQMTEAGMNDVFLHSFKGGYRMEYWKALGKDAQGDIMDGTWSEDFPYPGAKELGERYLKRWGYHTAMAGIYYATAQTLWAGIEKAGSVDSAKVRLAMSSVDIMTVMGPVKYNKEGFATHQPTAQQWWDGRQRLVYPSFKGGWKVKAPPF